MGGQRRYKVPMFDTTYRVVREATPKDVTMFGSDVLAEAEAEFARLAASTDAVLYLMHRARILRRSKEDDLG